MGLALAEYLYRDQLTVLVMATDIDDDSMLWKVIERWTPALGLAYLADESFWFLGSHVDTTE